MPPDDELAKIESQLDPAVRVVMRMLRDNNKQLAETLKELQEQLKSLSVQNAELRRMLFGPKSEKMPSMASEVRRALDADELLGEPSDSTGEASEPSPAEAETARRKSGRKRSEAERKKASAERKRKLPVVQERIAVNPEQLPEGYELSDFRKVGEGEIVRRVEHVREHLVAVEYVLETLASKDGEHIIAAQAPPTVVEGGTYGPGVYARAIVGKTDEILPLNRLARIFAREGLPIARSSLGMLFHRAAELLEPLHTALIRLARSDPYLNADETRMPVQDKKRCRKAWIWTFLSETVIIYHFSETRASKVAEEILGDSQRTLQVDGYSGYASSCQEGGRIRVGCWGHVRRMFFKCQQDYPEVNVVLEQIVELYKVEYLAAERGVCGTDAHLELRQTLSRPVTAKLIKWCRARVDESTPQSPLSKAIGYAINQWDSLVVFLDDPKLALDNNVSERAFRIQALGRNAFLFVGHDQAGQNLAILQSLVATCKLHQVNPYDYLVDVLIRVQTHPNSRLDELLPMNWQPPAAVATLAAPTV